MQEVDALRAERNRVASVMKGRLSAEERQQLVEAGKRVKEQLAGLEGELGALQARLQAEGQRLPNMTHPQAPRGDESQAVKLREVRGRGGVRQGAVSCYGRL